MALNDKIDRSPPTGAPWELSASDWNTAMAAIGALQVYDPSGPPGALNVKSYGAVGDGVADDTVAIRNTIALAASQGGGVVYIPPGTYKVMPQEARTHDNSAGYATESNVFVITSDNIVIQGAGSGITRLVFRGYGDVDPETTWQTMPSGGVWRGSGFFVAGGADYANRRRNFVVRDIEFDGGCDYTGNHNFPASAVTGDGWDITHKCVYLQNDKYTDGTRVERCKMHRWRGEIIYGGGVYHDNVYIENNDLRDTNGNCASLTMSGRITDNVMENAAGHFIENGYKSLAPLYIRGNVGRTCGLNGISVITVAALNSTPLDGDEGPVLITENIFRSCQTGIKALGACNVSVRNNTLIDCPTAASAGAYNGVNCENVGIDFNDGVVIDLVDAGGACEFAVGGGSTAGPKARGLSCRGNRTYLSRKAQAAGGLAAPSGANLSANADEYVASSGNINQGTVYADATSSRVRALTLSTTGDTVVSTLQPRCSDAAPSSYGSLIVAYLTLTVITAPTNVEARVSYANPAASGARNDYFVGASGAPVSLDVGVHHFGPFLISATRQGGNTARIYVKAGTANQVIVDALMRPEDT